MKQCIFCGLLLGLLLILPSCLITETPVTGVINDDQPSIIGLPAPIIAYTDDKGRSRSLASHYGNATVIAIVDEPNWDPESEIVKMSKDMADVTVVEICLTGKNRNARDQGTVIRNRTTTGRNIISLSDRNGLIPTRFNNAKSNSVFVLDRNGIIRQQGAISDLDTLKSNIRTMVQEAEQEDEDLYSGG